MPLVDQNNEPMNLVDEAELALKWRREEDTVWWDEFDDTPGIEAWTDLRPLGKRRAAATIVPGTEVIKAEPTDTGTMVQAREGGGVEEPRIRGDWLQIAKSQIGAPYVWADADPRGPDGGPGEGFDCSGFTAWLYSEAFGVALPHLSSAQQSSTQHISRENLRPGDLVFYHYSDRNGGGNTADHVEVYIGNGKTIGSSGGGVMVRNVNWDAFVGGGRVASVNTSFSKPQETPAHKAGRKNKGSTFHNDPTLIPASMGMQTNLADVQVGLLMGMRDEVGRRNELDDSVPSMSGSSSVKQIKAQLYRGFMDAGRPDLAKMVNTRDFSTWISGEGGWDPTKVSQFFPGHGRNAGIFQFALLERDWVWRDVSHSDGSWTYASSPYEQARNVARYFNLTPGDIRRYAAQIRSGTYGGWG